MLSSGGVAIVETASRFPIRLLESGPAAGALAAAAYGRASGHADLVSFDMGGTTAKLCVIEDGTPLVADEFEVDRVYRLKRGSGTPVKVPVIDMIEIGVGGGSIAYVDTLGLLKVGPRSAGADPGPVCYGLGGTEPTVTDADLVLGYLDPGYFLGGRMRLDVDAARAAIAREVASPLGLSLEEAAWGIHTIVNENMANAARVHAVERGKDPTALPLFAQYYRDKGLHGDGVVAVSPDPGRAKMARKFGEMLEADLAIMNKTRPARDSAAVTEVIGRVKGKVAIMTDDIIVTGGTLIAGAQALKDAGATEVYACATHALIPENAFEKLGESQLREVAVTDTVPVNPLLRPDNFPEPLTVSILLADTIKNVFSDESVSAIFAGENQLF